MFAFLFDFLIFGLISFILIIVMQFNTGFLMNKSFSLFGYRLGIKGVKGKSIEYVISKVI